MPIFPLTDEERRRRLALTPPINPDGGGIYADYPPRPKPGLGLPDVSTLERMPLPAAGAPEDIPMPRPALGRPQGRSGHVQEARDVYMLGTPGRGRSALSGALEGFLGGGGLLGAATGAIYGATDPRGLREREFNRKILPRIQEGFAYEDQDRALERQAAEDAINNQYKRAQIGALNRSNMPAPPKQPSYGSAPGIGIYNQQTGTVTTPAPPKEEKPPAPHWVRDLTGNYVDVNAPENKGKKVRGYDRPRAPKEPKAQAPKKVISISKVREAHKASGGKMSLSDVKASFIERGYRIVE